MCVFKDFSTDPQLSCHILDTYETMHTFYGAIFVPFYTQENNKLRISVFHSTEKSFTTSNWTLEIKSDKDGKFESFEKPVFNVTKPSISANISSQYKSKQIDDGLIESSFNGKP